MAKKCSAIGKVDILKVPYEAIIIYALIKYSIAPIDEAINTH